MIRRSLHTCAVAFIVFASVAAVAHAAGQPKPAYELFPRAIGVFAIGPPISEVGLQYQQWKGALGFQAMGGIYYNPLLSDTGKSFDYWAEVEGLYRVYGGLFADWLSGQLYLWARIGHEGYIETVYTSPPAGSTASPTVTTSPYVPSLIGGLGIGLEVILFEHFSLPIEFGYEGSLPFGYGEPIVSLSVSGGLRYRF